MAKTSGITVESIEKFIFESGSDHLPTFGGSFEGGVQCQQVADELAPCIAYLLESGPVETYLEIGSAAGGSAFIINHFFKPSRIVLVDDNAHPKAHIRPYVLRDVPHWEAVGNSHDVGTAAKVARLETVFDLLLIDGDHFYDGVKGDVKTYGEFLKPGGLLIFHDSRIGEPYGCWQVFNELKDDPGWEFIDEFVSKKHQPCGIGLFRKASE